MWANLVASVAAFVAALLDYLKANRLIELGRLREREANAQADSDLRDAIRNADPDSVSDSEAFGPDDDLSGAGKE